jgi:hypothetical protein
MSDIRFQLQTENAKQKFIRLLKNVDDMSPVFKLFIEEYKEIVAANFESRGRIMERGKWVDYKKSSRRAMTTRELKKGYGGYEGVSGSVTFSPYLKWKQRHYPDKPMMELSGDLKKAADDFKSDVGLKSLVMRVEGADYFYWVQERKTSPRYYFNTPDDDLPLPAWNILIKLAEDHITEGVE